MTAWTWNAGAQPERRNGERMKVPATPARVPNNTSFEINKRIEHATILRLEEIGFSPVLIDQRLRELDREWDIERAIEANAATAVMVGTLLGALSSRFWFALPGMVGAFLLQHSIQGWCPPVPVLRRLGFRTSREIDDERTLLLLRKGDLRGLGALPAEAALRVIAS